MSTRTAALLLGVAILPACAVGPDYVRPDIDGNGQWNAGNAARALPDAWWSAFSDPQLDALLARAARRNPDIRAASARLEEARAARGIARSALWPQAELDARYTSFEQSLESPAGAGSLIAAGLVNRDIDFYSASLDASWELDLFGRNRRQAEAAGASFEASIAERDAVRLAVLAETAAAYFELRGTQQRMAIVNGNIDSQAQTVALTERKVDAGIARRVDVLRARAQLNVARAEVPLLRAGIRANTYRLGVLTGRAPREMQDEVAHVASLPEAPGTLAVGTPAEVLRRRPDVVAAERQLAAATAGIGVATADFFPRLTLSGSFGFEADSASSIGKDDARTSAFVPFVSWPLLQGGRLRASLDAANARARAAAFQYEKTVLTALADAESAISAYAEEQEAFARLSEAAEDSNHAATIAKRLYEGGLADFLTVLDAERRRDDAADAKVQSHARLLQNVVRVYKALGGGWELPENS
jgi:multidrug efflux system outer membrane protein